ncbi:MAG: rubrerythrin [Methanobacteriota archaeon]|nr:MAG: rubrerythrin [Euryarchaeota archaeon]
MDIVEILTEAIESERKDREKYLELAKDAPDPETRAALEQLARDEEHHEKVLRERLAAVRLMSDLNR